MSKMYIALKQKSIAFSSDSWGTGLRSRITNVWVGAKRVPLHTTNGCGFFVASIAFEICRISATSCEKNWKKWKLSQAALCQSIWSCDSKKPSILADLYLEKTLYEIILGTAKLHNHPYLCLQWHASFKKVLWTFDTFEIYCLVIMFRRYFYYH